MAPDRVAQLRLFLRLVLVAIYLAVGALHLAAPDMFVVIVPPIVPFPRTTVLFTGACEIAGAMGLLIPPIRRWTGLMLAIYAVCVWPANLYQAFWHLHVPPLPDSWWYNGPRIAFQPVLIWWALFAAGVVTWPFKDGVEGRQARHSMLT